MAPVASARAVINIREGSVEMSVGLHQIRKAIAGEIAVYVIHIHPITQRIVGKYGTTRGVVGAALVPGQHSSHGNA
jgi:hypothetical protein